MTLTKSFGHKELTTSRKAALIARISDAVSFWGVILLSAVAVAAIALATPFVLAVAALAGLIAGNDHRSSWRPARA